MLGLAAAKIERIDHIDHIAQRIARTEAVGELGEYLPDLIFQRIGFAGIGLKRLEIGKQLAVDEIDQVLAGPGGVKVRLAILILWRGPAGPATFGIKDRLVFAPLQLSFIRSILLQIGKVFEEQEPAGLLGIVQLGSQPFIIAKGTVDIVEGVFEHGQLLAPAAQAAKYFPKSIGKF
ncbi:MAG: hypothetical protein WA985_02200 [Erythrobacter sp.]